MGCHGVGWHNPATLPELMCYSEFIILVALGRVKPERHERQAITFAFAENQETHGFETGGEVVGCAGQVPHDGTVALLAKADHLIVLADDLGGSFGEVEREGGLVCAEVVDVEDEFFGEELGRAPYDPSDTWVDLVAGSYFRQKPERGRD